MNNHATWKAYWAATQFAIIIGFTFFFVKISLPYGHSFDILAHRFSVSFLLLLAILLISRQKVRLSLRDIVLILPVAIFYPSVFFSFQTFGLEFISTSEAGILQAITPIATVILSAIFLHEYSSKLQIGFLLLSVAGVIYIFVMKGVNVDIADMKGAILVLISALSSSAYHVMTRKLGTNYAPQQLTFVMMLIGFVVFNGLALGRHIINGSILQYFEPLQSGTYLISIFYLGALASLYTSFLTIKILKTFKAAQLSVFSNISTLIAIIAGVVLLKEQLAYYHIIGGIAVLGGVIGMNMVALRKNSTPSSILIKD
ncbi:DMT family transporter [Paenibacillus endoradicis]|uniref:DMT family transporter n=1 Tax=Paenibacillus endoradicis TaxID=2972487 RepID=UPI00215965C2|nr:DMT family transporter [Paenibacillus endoradicis]MCR8660032.1 DMT family transporter [Paenibacillus endoradicis]